MSETSKVTVVLDADQQEVIETALADYIFAIKKQKQDFREYPNLAAVLDRRIQAANGILNQLIVKDQVK